MPPIPPLPAAFFRFVAALDGANSNEKDNRDCGVGAVAASIGNDGAGTRRGRCARSIVWRRGTRAGRRARWCDRRLHGRTVDCALMGLQTIRHRPPGAEARSAGDAGVACRRSVGAAKSGQCANGGASATASENGFHHRAAGPGPGVRRSGRSRSAVGDRVLRKTPYGIHRNFPRTLQLLFFEPAPRFDSEAEHGSGLFPLLQH